MSIYVLQQPNGKLVIEGSMTKIMQEIMKIARENSIPEVTYDEEIKATSFEFEGNYCNFKLYLS